MEKFYAKFEYGTPRLIKVEVIKETAKQYQCGKCIELLNSWYRSTRRIDKDDSIFDTQQEAIDWLIVRNVENLESARNQVKRLEDSLNELDKMLEGVE